jgi:hypothetical protein
MDNTGQGAPSSPKRDTRRSASDEIGWPQSQLRSSVSRRMEGRPNSRPSKVAGASKMSICFCPARYTFRDCRRSFGTASLFHSTETYEFHLPDCPFYTSPRRIRKLGARLYSISRFLSAAAMATISVTTGAGGFSIMPHLSFAAVVPNDSPAFALFSRDSSSYNHFFRRSDIGTTASYEILESTLQKY